MPILSIGVANEGSTVVFLDSLENLRGPALKLARYQCEKRNTNRPRRAQLRVVPVDISSWDNCLLWYQVGPWYVRVEVDPPKVTPENMKLAGDH